MTAPDPEPSGGAGLTTDRTRITVKRRTARWSDGPVSARDAMDFWAFAGGAANVVMQMSWPEVGYGVVESKVDSGNLLKHPWKRARTTLQYLAVAVLGNDTDRAAFRAAVDSAHHHVRSTESSPVAYNAFDRDLQMWVAACLFIGLEDTFQLLRGAMTEEQAEAFYQSAKPLGTTLQVTDEQWPASRRDFEEYWNASCERVQVGGDVRRYLSDLVGLKMVNPLLRLPFRGLLKFLTIGFLAPVFREALELSWSARKQRRFERLFLLVALINRFMPQFVRQGGSFVLLADVRRRVKAEVALV